MATRRQGAAGDPLAGLQADLARGLRPFYLITSESDWLRREAIALLREASVPAASRNFSYEERTLDSFSDWSAVEVLLRSYSFFDPRKLIVLEVPRKLSDALRASLARFLEETPGQNILCLSAPTLEQLVAAKNRIAKQGGLVLKLEMDGEAALTAWATRRLQAAGLEFERDFPAQLVGALPPDPGELASEIEKLRLASPLGHRLGQADLERLVGYQRAEDVWRLAELLRPEREREALACLERLLAAGGDPPALIGALSYTFTQLLRAHLLLAAGRSPGAAAAALGLWPERARELVARAQGLSRRELLTWLLNLQKLDARLKRGPGGRDRQLLETAILASLRGQALRA
ncbi:DNA polymerase III subunit delta [bacterium]|nr:DNA polymerase III subunit delta [bacterium]